MRLINTSKNRASCHFSCVSTKIVGYYGGGYTYFLGEEVTSFDKKSEEFETLTIPVQTYAKFTSLPGQMPKVVIDMWQNIWKMGGPDLGGNRAYIDDFEVYDERSRDPSNAILDIYIGIKK